MLLLELKKLKPKLFKILYKKTDKKFKKTGTIALKSLS